MTDVVLIPCWRRPEFLWHCLQNICKADGADQMHYIFRPDVGFNPEVLDLIKKFPYSYEVQTTPLSKHTLTKQSYSLLTGYLLAANKSERFVYMIEEDVYIAKDFFSVHQELHRLHPELFCSITTLNPNRHTPPQGNVEDYYLSQDDYCSLGVCYHKDTILTRIGPYASDAYFRNPVSFCKSVFPKSPFGQHFVEQDGLIRRIQWNLGAHLPIAFTCVPRSYHAGFYGKNRGGRMGGSTAEKMALVGSVSYSDAEMRRFAERPEFYEDSKPVDLNPQSWHKLNRLSIDLRQSPLKA